MKAGDLPSFTCPVCSAVSHNPNDVRWGYCGACHDWTGESITQLTLDLADEDDATPGV